MAEVIDVGMGEICVAEKPDVLRTNLGSCVAVLLYEPNLKIGGMAHIVSPESIQELNKTTTNYADIAIPSLIEFLAEKGCNKKNLRCYVTGGGCMFGGMSEMMDIGKKNLESVRNILKNESITVKEEGVGGNCSTSVNFYTDTGRLELERRETNLKIVYQAERDYQKKWVTQKEGDVTKLEAYLKQKQDDFINASTRKLDSEKLIKTIRLYSSLNGTSRLIGYVVYSKFIKEYGVKAK